MSDDAQRREFRDRDRDALSRFEQLSPVSPSNRLDDDDMMGQGQQGYVVGDFGAYKAPRRQAAKPYDRPKGRLKKVKLVRDMESEEFKEYVVLWVKGAVFYNGLAEEAHTVREETMWRKTADRYVEARGMHVSYFPPGLATPYWDIAAEYVDSVRNHRDDPGRVGLRKVGAGGSYNQYYHILRPDSGLTPMGLAQWVAVGQLMDVLGYEEWEYTLSPEERHARSLGPGRLPFGIGVRIQKKDLRPSMNRRAEEGEVGHKRVYGEGKVFGYDAAITGLFAEMYVTMMMANHGLAPPVIATALVQDKYTERRVHESFQIRAVTISANVEMSLDGMFDKIQAEHRRDDYYSPERVAWLEALGTEISRVLAETSRLRVLLLDMKPDNMLYAAEGPPDAPELSKTHRVYMTDFDTKFTVVLPENGFSPMDGGCIEMLNTLLFLNFINCWHDFHDYGRMPMTYPILDIVARPIRARLRGLAHGVDVLNADSTSSNPLLMESHLCKLLSSLPLPMDRIRRPILYTGSRQYPDKARIEKIAHSFMEMAWHYGEHRNLPLENKCWPYKREGSLILQMYRYLSEYRDSAERDSYEGDSMRRREPRGPSVAACQLDGVSVVDEVFARMGM